MLGSEASKGLRRPTLGPNVRPGRMSDPRPPAKPRPPSANQLPADDDLDEELDFIEAEPDPLEDALSDPDRWPDDDEDESSRMFDEDTVPIVVTDWDDVEITDDADIDLEWAAPAVQEPAPIDDEDDIELPVLPLVFEAQIDGMPIPARIDLSLTQTTLSELRPSDGERAVVAMLGPHVLSLRVAVVAGPPGLSVAPDVLRGRFLVRP